MVEMNGCVVLFTSWRNDGVRTHGGGEESVREVGTDETDIMDARRSQL